MDVKDIISHLQALQDLYNLLESHTNGTPSDILDENASNVFKSLLDAATKNVLNAKAEVIGARTETLSSVSPAQVGPSEEPIQNMVSGLTPGLRPKTCKLCRKSTAKHIEFAEAKRAQDSFSVINFQHQQKDQSDRSVWNNDQAPAGSVVIDNTHQYVDIGRRAGSVIGDMGDFGYTEVSPDEASEEIKQRNLSIKALHHEHLRDFIDERNHVESVNQNRGPKVKAIIERIESGKWRTMVDCNQSNKAKCSSNEASEEIKQLDVSVKALHHEHFRDCIDEHNRVESVNKDRRPKVKAIIERIESGKWMMNNDNRIQRYTRAKLYSGHARSNSSGNLTSNEDVQSTNASHHVSQIRGAHVKSYTSRRRKAIPVSNKKRRYGTTPMTLLRPQKSKISVTSSSYSSSRTSHGDHSYNSESEKYSSSVSTRRNSSGTSASSKINNSRTSNSSSSGSTSASESDVSSSTYSHKIHRPMKSTLGRAGPSRIGKQPDGFNHNMIGGTLKKLKDRLGGIFHQHSHHSKNDDHHNHRNKNDDHHNHHSKKDDHHKGKSLVSSRKAKASAEKVVGKMHRAVVHGKAKDKISHFHGLMGAVLSHVHGAKKLKAEENGGVRLQNAIKKKARKKSQFANLTKKAHVKLVGVGKPKTRLKALPNIK